MGRKVEPSEMEDLPAEAHLTGQQLCEAIRQYSLAQYGLMAKSCLEQLGCPRNR